jgi:hypothetical protein
LSSANGDRRLHALGQALPQWVIRGSWQSSGLGLDDRTNVLREMLQEVAILGTDGSRCDELAVQVCEKFVEALVH